MLVTTNSQDILDEIIEFLPGSKLYSHYVAAVCLWHKDTQPSLFIYPDTYKCSACGAFGSTQKLLNNLKNRGISGAGVVQLTTKRYNPFHKWLSEVSLADFLKASYRLQADNPHWCTYLDERKIDAKCRRTFKIGIRDSFYLLPVIDSSKNVIGAVARSGKHATGSRYYIPKDQNPSIVYNSDNFHRLQGKLFLTFGMFDAISVYLCGYRCLSTTTGKQLDASALDSFRERIYFFPDDGEYMNAKAITRRLGWRGAVIKVDYPSESKDPNDLLRFHPETLQEILAGV
jgi:hypothetical protein